VAQRRVLGFEAGDENLIPPPAVRALVVADEGDPGVAHRRQVLHLETGGAQQNGVEAPREALQSLPLTVGHRQHPDSDLHLTADLPGGAPHPGCHGVEEVLPLRDQQAEAEGGVGGAPTGVGDRRGHGAGAGEQPAPQPHAVVEARALEVGGVEGGEEVEARAAKARAPQVGSEELGRAQIGAGEAHRRLRRPFTALRAAAGAVQPGTLQPTAHEAGGAEGRFMEAGRGEVGAKEVGAGEVGLPQVGAGEVGAMELGR